MATFTSAQQAQIRMYLGYPDLNRYKDTRLEGVIGADVVSSDCVALVVAALAQLVANDAIVYGTGGVAGVTGQGAGVSGVGKGAVTFFQGQKMTELGSIRKQLAGRISNALGVPFYGNAFGTSGYPGDSYSSELGSGNGRGIIPLG